jgi:hypothetical protein
LKKFLQNKYVFALTFLAIGMLGSFLLMHSESIKASACLSDFKFINPQPDCEFFEDKSQKALILQRKLEVVVSNYKQSGKLNRIGVFARDLLSRRFVGVNDTDEFYMASLLKLPLVIGAYKLAEVESTILNDKILYTGVPNLYGIQYFMPKEKLEVGKEYSAEELARRSLQNSDNTSAQLLFSYFPEGFLDRVERGLGIQIKRQTGMSEEILTARTYGNIFRILYNSSYLKREYSNAILSVLAHTSFTNGAIAKLPSGVLVSHKFGERASTDSSGSVVVRQLHDCGIVYAKDGKEPYTFCILTEGSNFKDLEEVIQDISLEIYNSMVNNTEE